MKKITALLLSLAMILCAVCVFAEDTGKTEMGTLNVGTAFSIRSKVPEGYSLDEESELYTDPAYGEWTLRLRKD